MLPNVRGLITTDDGASILFELHGRTVFGDDPAGRQSLVGWFEAEDERYRWLNDIVCIAEGRIDVDGMHVRVFAGVHETRRVVRGRRTRAGTRAELARSQACIRIATLYFVTDVRLPGVSPAGIALSAASPFW